MDRTLFRCILLVSSLAVAAGLMTRHSAPRVVANETPVMTDGLATELLVRLNQERTVRGLDQLTPNQELTHAAQAKASTLLSEAYFDHTTRAGQTPWDFIRRAGYRYRSAGENLAIDFTSATAIHAAWLASPMHRDNMLDPAFQDVGIAAVTGQYGTRTTTLVVEEFGSHDPRSPIERSFESIIALELINKQK